MIGATREYFLISILVNVACLGIHLLIIMTQPKCLQVIKEERLKRYKILQRCYFITSLLVPVLFVPWPFISTLKKYEKGVYVCWLQDSICGTSIASEIVTKSLMWYLWAILAWLFAVIVFAVTFYRHCAHSNHQMEY